MENKSLNVCGSMFLWILFAMLISLSSLSIPQKLILRKNHLILFLIYSNFMPENTNFKLQTDLGLKVKNIEKQKNKININKAKRIKKFSFTFKNKEDRLNINRNENNTERII